VIFVAANTVWNAKETDSSRYLQTFEIFYTAGNMIKFTFAVVGSILIFFAIV
jgi:hypothetical protein